MLDLQRRIPPFPPGRCGPVCLDEGRGGWVTGSYGSQHVHFHLDGSGTDPLCLLSSSTGMDGTGCTGCVGSGTWKCLRLETRSTRSVCM